MYLQDFKGDVAYRTAAGDIAYGTTAGRHYARPCDQTWPHAYVSVWNGKCFVPITQADLDAGTAWPLEGTPIAEAAS